MNAKTPRIEETREKTSRRKPWTPPSSLDSPPAPEGFIHRWIRASYAGIDDKKNMSSRIREGFELVRAEDYPDFEAPTIQDGRHAGVIGVGGLVLARFPIETREERNAYFNKRTRDQMVAVDNDVMREQHSAMPISIERKSNVTFGPRPEKSNG